MQGLDAIWEISVKTSGYQGIMTGGSEAMQSRGRISQLIIVAVALGVALVTTACGGGDERTATPVPTTIFVPSPTTATPVPKVVQQATQVTTTLVPSPTTAPPVPKAVQQATQVTTTLVPSPTITPPVPKAVQQATLAEYYMDPTDEKVLEEFLEGLRSQVAANLRAMGWTAVPRTPFSGQALSGFFATALPVNVQAALEAAGWTEERVNAFFEEDGLPPIEEFRSLFEPLADFEILPLALVMPFAVGSVPSELLAQYIEKIGQGAFDELKSGARAPTGSEFLVLVEFLAAVQE